MDDRITLTISKSTLARVLQEIDNQTPYSFTFLKEDFSGIEVKELNLRDVSLGEALKQLQQNYAIEYAERNGVIMLRIAGNKTTSKKKEGFVSGKLTDEKTGEPLISGIIRIGNQSVQSDIDGKFLMNVPEGEYTAFASNMGYANLSIQQVAVKAGDTTQLKLKMKLSSNELNEVVVTALGIKREEKALGYSITKLDNQDVTDAMSNNWTNTMEGKVAGLNMLKSNGGPGGTNAIIQRTGPVITSGKVKKNEVFIRKTQHTIQAVYSILTTVRERHDQVFTIGEIIYTRIQ